MRSSSTTRRREPPPTKGAADLLRESEQRTRQLERDLRSANSRLASASRLGDRGAMDRATASIERLTRDLAREEQIRQAAFAASQEEAAASRRQRLLASCDEMAGMVPALEATSLEIDTTVDRLVRLLVEVREGAAALIRPLSGDRQLAATVSGLLPSEQVVHELLLQRLRGAGLLRSIGKGPRGEDENVRVASALRFSPIVDNARNYIASLEGGEQ